jgi:solute carrier family 66 (lysosomal lysine-arginine transporter), member 1
MSPLSEIFAANLPDHCSPTTPFLHAFSSYFHICVPTPLAFLSTVLGTLSIVSWLFAQLPQIYKNYTLQSTAGLSIFFLVEWCLGDATNLLGALFTRQAGWQIVVAGYYVFVDVMLVSQYFWYTHFKPWREGGDDISVICKGRDNGSGPRILDGVSPQDSSPRGISFRAEPDHDREPKGSSTPKAVPGSLLRSGQGTPNEKATPSSSYRPIVRVQGASYSPIPSPRAMLFISMLCAVLANASHLSPEMHASLHVPQVTGAPETPTQIAGRILSWCSTILYLGSRLPQLYKNHVRRSTAGLSPLLFFAAFCGNLFYSSSLLTNPCAWYTFPAHGGHGWVGEYGSERWEWVSRAAPFWLGAAGVLALDGAVGVQFIIFGERSEEKVVKVKDSRGRSRWKRVSGWMRGWVPSMSPERKMSFAEAEALLSRQAEGYGSV